MADCCTPNTARVGASCPRCGRTGKPVGLVTLESLLNPAMKTRLLTDESYCFCASPACSAAYFSVSGALVVAQEDVTVPIWQKHPAAAEVPVCYCFGHTPGRIRDEIVASGTSDVVATITAKVKAGLCACETSNPQGSCCLGNVNMVVKQAKLIGERR